MASGSRVTAGIPIDGAAGPPRRIFTELRRADASRCGPTTTTRSGSAGQLRRPRPSTETPPTRPAGPPARPTPGLDEAVRRRDARVADRGPPRPDRVRAWPAPAGRH